MLSHWLSVEQIGDFIRERLEKSSTLILIALQYSVIDEMEKEHNEVDLNDLIVFCSRIK